MWARRRLVVSQVAAIGRAGCRLDLVGSERDQIHNYNYGGEKKIGGIHWKVARWPSVREKTGLRLFLQTLISFSPFVVFLNFFFVQFFGRGVVCVNCRLLVDWSGR